MIDIKDLEILAKDKKEENFYFRLYLKKNADELKLDKQFKRLHYKYFNIYDCKKCRNCCKKLSTIMDKEELDTICNYLNIDKDKYIKDYLIINEEGDYSFKDHNCKFLDKCNNCMVEEYLPVCCMEYPFTNCDEMLYRLINVVYNASICPVVYEILEDLKKIYNFK